MVAASRLCQAPPTFHALRQRAYHVRMTDQFDVVIVGGGLVGMSLAAALQDSALSVLHIEAQAPVAQAEQWDERHFALGKASIERLQKIGAWPSSLSGTPIREVHVSRAGEFGRVLLSANDLGFEAFGATVPARSLVAALEQRLAQCSRVVRWRPARLLRSTLGASHAELDIQTEQAEQRVRCRLLVAADGTDSAIRSALAIPEQRVDYRQTALVCAAQTERAHGGRAFERFTDDGPIAVLPLSGNRCGVVCTLDDVSAVAAAALSDTEYLRLLQQRFGHRLGRFERVGRRQPWPLRLMLAERLIDQRVVLIGNAAQTIHPIGAQGFNLGLRDADALAGLVSVTDDPGAADVLQRYADQRAADRAQTVRSSDAIVKLSSGRGPLLYGLRALGMAIIDRVPMMSKALAMSAMGYREIPR